jgi:nucleotide-binding universal stress UspA family protein
MTTSPARRRRQRIVVGVDGSAGSRAALRWAAEEAELRDADLEAVMAQMPPLPMPLFGPGSTPVPTTTAPLDPQARTRVSREALEELLHEAFGAQLPSRLSWHFQEGHPVQVLLGRTADADLLVVGARGEGGFVGLLTGSASEQCVRHATCSVVVVRQEK